MTAVDHKPAPAPTAQRPTPADLTGSRLTFLGVLRSEWIKFFAVRSTTWILLTTIVVMLGFTAMMAASFRFAADNPDIANVEGMPMDSSVGLVAAVFGYSVGQIVLAVLGAMIITGEYSSGRIRSTLVAVPTRTPVFVAKILVGALVSFLVGLVAVILAYLLTTAVVGPDLAPDVSADGQLEALIGVPLYLMAITLFALGIGAIVRHTAGAIAISLAVLLVLPTLGQIGNLDWLQTAVDYLPSSAGERLIYGEDASSTLSPWQGYAVLAGWSVITLAAGAITLKKRDA